MGVKTIEVKDSTDTSEDVDVNLLKIPPVSLMIQAAYTYKTKEQPGELKIIMYRFHNN